MPIAKTRQAALFFQILDEQLKISLGIGEFFLQVEESPVLDPEFLLQEGKSFLVFQTIVAFFQVSPDLVLLPLFVLLQEMDMLVVKFDDPVSSRRILKGDLGMAVLAASIEIFLVTSKLIGFLHLLAASEVISDGLFVKEDNAMNVRGGKQELYSFSSGFFGACWGLWRD